MLHGMSAFGARADTPRIEFSRVETEVKRNTFTGCSKRQQIVCRQKPKQIVRDLRRSSRLYVGPQRSALNYIID